MTDKERILMTIITRIIPGLMYYGYSYEKREEYVKSYMLDTTGLQCGDLVFANTTIYPNDFVVGFIHEIKPDCVTIREIGSDRICNYYNEAFTKINKDKLGYEALEGIQYEVYQKIITAFRKYATYNSRLKKVSFDGDICTVAGRKKFSDETMFEISFKYNKKTTIKSIGKLINEAEEK